MALNAFTKLCSHRYCPYFFNIPTIKSGPIKRYASLFPHYLVTSIQLCVSEFVYSRKCNHTTFVLWLISLTEHSVSKVHPHCSTCQHSSILCLFMAGEYPSVGVYVLFTHSSVDWLISCQWYSNNLINCHPLAAPSPLFSICCYYDLSKTNSKCSLDIYLSPLLTLPDPIPSLATPWRPVPSGTPCP